MAQTGEQITNVNDLQDIDELLVVEVRSAHASFYYVVEQVRILAATCEE